MVETSPVIHVFVVADDPVAAGMLALDLVQAGVTAQAVADEEALLTQLRVLDGDPERIPALVINHRGLEQASALSRRLISEAIRCHVLVAVRDEEQPEAEQEAALLGWLALVRKPVDAEVVARHLAEAPEFVSSQIAARLESGDLFEAELGDVITALVNDDPRPLRDINAVLQLKSNGRSGSIAIVAGELVHAQTAEEQGRHALERMFCWKQGSWRVVRGIHSGPRSLKGSLRNNVAAAREYGRRVFQNRSTLPYLDQACTVRWERVRPLPAVAESMFRRIAMGMLLGQALEGDGDDELEAFAALHSRIKRGAVLPLDRSSESEFPSKIPGRRRHSQPISMSGGEVMVSAEPASSRHAETSSYLAIGDLPVGDSLPDDLPNKNPQEGASAAAGLVLPDSLPDFDPDSAPYTVEDAQPTAALQVVEALPSRRSTVPSGWFGVNINREGDEEVTTDVSAVQRAVLEAVARESEESSRAEGSAGPDLGGDLASGADSESGAGFESGVGVDSNAQSDAPSISTSMTRKERVIRPAAAGVRTESQAHFAAWSNDFEEKLDQEASVIEQLRGPDEANNKRTLLWLLAAAAVAALLGLVLMPGAPLFHMKFMGDGEVQESSVVKTYREAVELIDADRLSEARVQLARVCGQPGVAPEAFLQLAVVELRGGMSEQARVHLGHYLDDPTAAEHAKASALYAHVFGPRAAPQDAP